MARKTSFYYSFLVLPADQRRAIVAVWDFCRAVDDAVDEADVEPPAGAQSPARGASRSGARSSRAASTANAPRTPQGRALQPFIARVRSAAPGVRGRDRRRGDGSRHAPATQTFDDLFEYCRRVASAVGMICIRIFGCRSEQRARLRAQPRRRAAAHQHPPRRQGRSGARPRVSAARGSRAASAARSTIWQPGVVTEPVRRLIAFECARARDFYQRARRRAPAGGSPAARRRRDHARGVLRDAAGASSATATTCSRARTRVPRPRAGADRAADNGCCPT